MGSAVLRGFQFDIVLTRRTNKQMAVSSSLFYGYCADSIALFKDFLVRRILADEAGNPRLAG